MAAPLTGIAAILKKLLGSGSVAEQFFVWGVISGVVSTGLEPFMQELRNKLQSDNPVMPITPAELADMVVKNILKQEEAAQEARKSGVPEKDFDLMVKVNGEPPAIGELLTLFRRHQVTDEQLTKAIRQSHIRDEWIDTVKRMGIQFPTPAFYLEALLKGQIDHDDAHQKYIEAGGDPDSFQLEYDTGGEAPTPDQAAEMAKRRIIPWSGRGPGVVSYEQAFLEGRWRNKWMQPFHDASDYLPPPRTVTAMLKEGALTTDEAQELLEKQGLTPHLAAQYIIAASKQKTAKQRDLTVATIEKLVIDRAITEEQALSYLKHLDYDDADAGYIIALAKAQRLDKFRDSAITAVHSQFVERKIDESVAGTTLDRFGIPSQQRDDLIALWKLERTARVRVLTAAEVKKAVNKSVIDADAGLQRLVDMGYSEDDAKIYLVI